MSITDGHPLDDRMRLLEHRAEIARTRFFRAIDALGTRRHRVQTMSRQAKRLALPLVASVAAVAALAAGSVLLVGYAIKRRRTLSSRIDRLVSTKLARRPSFALSLVHKASLTLVTIMTTEVARRTAKNFFDGRLPDGRLAAAGALEAHHRELAR